MNWTKRLSRCVPPGTDLRAMAISYGLCMLVFLVFWGASYFIACGRAVQELYELRYGVKTLRDDAVMPTLNALIQHRLAGFWVYALVCGYNVWANYASFSQQTKSIYVMKRLPSSRELHRRCLTMPAAALAAGILVCAVLLLLFVLVYRHSVPARCMPPEEILNVWGAFF